MPVHKQEDGASLQNHHTLIGTQYIRWLWFGCCNTCNKRFFSFHWTRILCISRLVLLQFVLLQFHRIFFLQSSFWTRRVCSRRLLSFLVYCHSKDCSRHRSRHYSRQWFLASSSIIYQIINKQRNVGVTGIPSRYPRPVVDTFPTLRGVHSSSILPRDITV